MREDRLEDERLAGTIGDPARGQSEVLHAGLAGSGDAELVAHPEGEVLHWVLIVRSVARQSHAARIADIGQVGGAPPTRARLLGLAAPAIDVAQA